MLPDDARAWLRDLVALPEEDAAAELAARFLGEREAAYRAGAAEMAPGVRDAERDAVVRLIQEQITYRRVWPSVVRKALGHFALAIAANQHREGA